MLPKEGQHRLVRHLDDLVEGEEPQLHVHVDGLHHLAVANATATGYFGEAPVSPQGLREAEKQSAGHCETFHATDEEYWKKIYLLEHAVEGVPRWARAHLHGLLAVDQRLDRDQGVGRRGRRDRSLREAVPASPMSDRPFVTRA